MPSRQLAEEMTHWFLNLEPIGKDVTADSRRRRPCRLRADLLFVADTAQHAAARDARTSCAATPARRSIARARPRPLARPSPGAPTGLTRPGCGRCRRLAGVAHGLGQAALDRIGRRARRIGRGGGPRVGRGDAAAGPSAEGAGEQGLSGRVRPMASAQAGGSFASGQRRKPVPICAAEAPSISAAAMPRASAMPPVATTGTRTASTTAGSRANRPTSSACACSDRGAAMAAGLHALRHDHLGARSLRGPCLGHGGDIGEPGDALGLQALDEVGRVEAHDEEITGRPGVQQGLALRSEVERRGVTCFARDLGPHRRGRRAPPPRPRVTRGGGSGIQRLMLKPPLLPARNSAAQSLMASGRIRSAPQAPRPPARATAMESEAGQAPAIGASRMGTRRP